MAGRDSFTASTVDFLPPVEVLKPQRPPRTQQCDLLDTDDLISATAPPSQPSQQGTPQRGGALDVLSLYNAPKPEPPPKPVMLNRGGMNMGGSMMAPMMLPQQQQQQQMPMMGGMGVGMNAGPLGRGRPLPVVPPQQQQSMMMGGGPARPSFGINTANNGTSSGSNIYRGTGVISSASSSTRGGKPADPFDSLYQSAKK